MCCTRDASLAWQHHFTEHHSAQGFFAGGARPALFDREARSIRRFVRGDALAVMTSQAGIENVRLRLHS